MENIRIALLLTYSIRGLPLMEALMKKWSLHYQMVDYYETGIVQGSRADGGARHEAPQRRGRSHVKSFNKMEEDI